MFYYVRYENYAIAVESDTKVEPNTNFINVKKVYQLLTVPGNIKNMDGSTQMRNVKMLKYDSDNKETYSVPESNGNFHLNVGIAQEISELNELPKLEDLSKEEFRRIQVEMIKKQQAAKQAQNKY